MRHVLFSVYDEKAVVFLPPFAYPSPGQAIRAFGDLCQDKNHPVGAHPEDYRLYRIGEFDDSDGSVKKDSAVLLVSGSEVAGGPAGMRVVS